MKFKCSEKTRYIWIDLLFGWNCLYCILLWVKWVIWYFQWCIILSKTLIKKTHIFMNKFCDFGALVNTASQYFSWCVIKSSSRSKFNDSWDLTATIAHSSILTKFPLFHCRFLVPGNTTRILLTFDTSFEPKMFWAIVINQTK